MKEHGDEILNYFSFEIPYDRIIQIQIFNSKEALVIRQDHFCGINFNSVIYFHRIRNETHFRRQLLSERTL